MTLLTFLRDPETGFATYAILAEDTDAERLYANGEKNKVSDSYAHFGPDWDKPTDARGWTVLALSSGTGILEVQEPQELDAKKAKAQAKVELEESARAQANAPGKQEWATAQAADEIYVDDPELLESVSEGEDFDDQSFLNYVMMNMGTIDPDGPNGWLLRAAEGITPPEDAVIDMSTPLHQDDPEKFVNATPQEDPE